MGPLPAGNYVVIAKAAVENLDHTAQWLCSLLLDNDAPVDSTDTHTDSQGIGEHIARSAGPRAR